MQLLSPREILTQKDAKETERKIRVKKLADDERDLVHIVNTLRSMEKEEKDRIAKDLEEFKTQKEKEKVSIQEIIDEKKAEVEALETRKAEAMKPIDDLMAQATKLLADNNQKARDLEQNSFDLKKKDDELEKVDLSIIVRREELLEQEKNLDIREALCLSEEVRLKGSSEALSNEWREYLDRVEEFEVEMRKREKSVQDGLKSNEDVRKYNEEETSRIRQLEKGVLDRFATVTKHMKNLGINNI